MSAKVLGDSGVLYTDRRDFYIDPQVVKELWTDVAPFTTVISNRETRATNDPVFKMFEHRNPWVKQTITMGTCSDGSADKTVPDNDTGIKFGNAANPATPVASVVGLDSFASNPSAFDGLIVEVADSAGAVKGKALLTWNGTDIMIKSLKAATIELATGDVCTVIGNAHGEGTDAPDAWADELKTVWNSTQIFKTPLEITGTLLQASLRGESSELARLRNQKNQEHKMQKEKAFLFGVRLGGTNLDPGSADTFADGGRTDANGKKVRSTYGIVSALEDFGNGSGDDQNKFAVSESSYTYSNFVDDMEKVFQYVPEAGIKRAFVGAGALGYWSKLSGTGGMAGNSSWTVNLGDMKRDTLGFNYRVLETPHGMLQLIPTPALRGAYNKTMLVVDDANLFHAQYRSPMFQANIKTENAYDGVKDQYFSDEGVGVSLIESHALFTIS
jgi:hypothetical protein